ncbi:hypothetical protein [Nostoc sp.]|uniref:hypothetical protein n=1 Tax=Nostoc sp. TaxID=1180 RepID=UPI002FF651E3
MPIIRKYYSSQQLGWLGRKVHCSQAMPAVLASLRSIAQISSLRDAKGERL